jgi:putative phosphoesterase
LKLLVVSDTHIPERTGELPGEILEAAEDADGIIHAGDFTGEEVLGLFRGMGPPLYAVRGNMDVPGVARALDDRLVFELDGVRIGVTHGSGPPQGLDQRVRQVLPAGLDVMIFGHSHRPMLEDDNGLLLLNPGSPAGGPLSGQRSYGLLFIEDGRARGELRYL